MLASKASPGLTGTMGPSAPESTISPARSGRLRLASSPASHAITIEGIAEARGARSLRDDLFPARHLHLQAAEVQAVEATGSWTAEDEKPR